MTTDTRLPDFPAHPAPITVATGELVLLTGPMFAGKSAALIGHARAEAAARDGDAWAVLALKPAFDVRDGAAVLSSRDGSRIAALPVASWPPEASRYGAVVIDEVQFMVAPHYDGDIVRDVLAALRSGQRVVAGGLDTDYARRPFEPVARLAEHAHRHRRLFARCHRCGAPAAWTAKRADTGRRLELGSDGLYEARCDAHWSLPAPAAIRDPTATAASPAAIPAGPLS